LQPCAAEDLAVTVLITNHNVERCLYIWKFNGKRYAKNTRSESGALTARSILENTPLFQELTPLQQETIARIGRLETLCEGSHLYKIGDSAADFYILGRGAVRFTIGNGDSQPSAGRILWPSGVFGWAAVIEQSPRRIATATCLTDSVALALPGRQLIRLMDVDHDMGYLLMKRLNSLVVHHPKTFG
jgi:CRP-like cAMP-binding protein